MALNVPKDVNIQRQLTNIHVKEWLQGDVFHLRWWLLICMVLLFLLVWWIMLDKSRLLEICLYAALAAIIVLGINEYGEELTLWDYPTDIIAIFPPLSSINLISLPFIYSLIYQHFKTRKSFIWATIIGSAVICFILEPLLSWGGFYQLIHWKYYYSFPIYISFSIFIRMMVIKIYAIKHKFNAIP
jgi:hypothetical protein